MSRGSSFWDLRDAKVSGTGWQSWCHNLEIFLWIDRITVSSHIMADAPITCELQNKRQRDQLWIAFGSSFRNLCGREIRDKLFVVEKSFSWLWTSKAQMSNKLKSAHYRHSPGSHSGEWRAAIVGRWQLLAWRSAAKLGKLVFSALFHSVITLSAYSGGHSMSLFHGLLIFHGLLNGERWKQPWEA